MKCKICNKEFESKMALAGHMASHKDKTSGVIRHERMVDEYNKNQKLCLNCKKPLPYEKRRNKFCSQSCGASFNNSKRKKEFIKVNNVLIKRKTISYCKNCGKEIDIRKKYCDIVCQKSYEKSRELINGWKLE